MYMKFFKKNQLIKNQSLYLCLSLLVYFFLFDEINKRVYTVVEHIVYKNLGGVLQKYFFNTQSINLLTQFFSNTLSFLCCFLLFFIFNKQKDQIKFKLTSNIDFIYITVFSVSVFFITKYIYSYVNSILGLPTYTDINNIFLITNKNTVFVYLFISILLVPLFDELFFRIFLLNGFKKINITFAIVLQALIYIFKFNNFNYVIPYFCISLILGYVYVIYENFYFIFFIRMTIAFIQNFLDFIQFNKLAYNFQLTDIIIILIIIIGILSTVYILKNFDFKKFIFKNEMIGNFFDTINIFFSFEFVVVTFLICGLKFFSKFLL